MRALLANGKEFKNRFCKVNNIKNRNGKIIDEKGCNQNYTFSDNLIR